MIIPFFSRGFDLRFPEMEKVGFFFGLAKWGVFMFESIYWKLVLLCTFFWVIAFQTYQEHNMFRGSQTRYLDLS